MREDQKVLGICCALHEIVGRLMMETEVRQEIRCLTPDGIVLAEVFCQRWNTSNNYFSVHVVENSWGHLVAESYNVLDAFRRLRCVLETRGFKVCCQGSRRDAWLSRMGKVMEGGKRVSLGVIGEKIKSRDLVPIFDPAPPELCVSVAKQFEYQIGELSKKLGFEVLSNLDKLPGQYLHDAKLHCQGVVYRIDRGVELTLEEIQEIAHHAPCVWKVDELGRVEEV